MERQVLFRVLRLMAVIVGMFSSSTFLVIYNKWFVTVCPQNSPQQSAASSPTPPDETNATSSSSSSSPISTTCRGFGFRYPVFLTATHMAMIWIVCSVLIHVLRVVPRPSVSRHVYIRFILPFAVLVALDIALSNSAFLHLEASYVEMLKSGTPAAVLLLSVVTGLESLQTWNAAVIATISGGLTIASRGEARFSLIGLGLVLFAVFSGAVRMVLSQFLLQKNLSDESRNSINNSTTTSSSPSPSTTALNESTNENEEDAASQRAQLSSIQVLYYQTPISFLVLLPLTYNFFADVRSGAFAPTKAYTIDLVLFIVLGAMMAFVLDMFNLLMIKYSSALSSSVAGCFKTTIVILFSWLFFRNPLTMMNLLGYLICLIGVVGYNIVKYRQLVQQYALEAEPKSSAVDEENVALTELHAPQSASASGELSDGELPADLKLERRVGTGQTPSPAFSDGRHRARSAAVEHTSLPDIELK